MTKQQHGFTLIELMVTIAVLAIVLSIAAPGLRSVIQNNRAAAISNELVSALQLARSEAIKRAVAVQVCPSNDQVACGGSWNDGWIVQVSGAATLQAWQRPLGGGGFANAAALPTAITFVPEGRTTAASSTTFQLVMPGCTGQANRNIELSSTGRVNISKAGCDT